MNYKRVFPVLFAAESIFLFYMAFQPGYAIPTFHIPFLRGGDFEHFIGYLIYGILGYRTFSMRSNPRESFFISLAFCGIYAAFTEAIQMFVPTRFADPADWLVDFIGSSAGILAARSKYPQPIWNKIKRVWKTPKQS